MTDDDYKKLDSRLNVEVRSVLLAHPPMLADVFTRIAQHYADVAERITVTCNKPERDGSIMYTMVVEYRSGGGITLGVLRRSPDAETEWHS